MVRLSSETRELLLRYGRAGLVIAATVAIRLALEPWLGDAGFAIFLGGVLVASWVGGLGPALVCQTLLLMASGLLFEDRQSQQRSPQENIAGLLAYFAIGAIVGILSDKVRAALKRATARAAEAAAQREWLRATLTCMADGVLATDPAGNVTMFNPAAERMTGRRAAEAVGQPVASVLPIRSPGGDDLADPVQRVLAERVPHVAEGLLAAPGQCLPIAYHAAPIVDAGGATTGVVLVFRDETERQRIEAALRSADRRKDEFIATLAHELRNPLAPIRGGLDLLKLAPDDPATIEEVHSMLQRQTDQMVRLIDDLLDVSRFARGKLKICRARTELSHVVKSAVEASEPMIESCRHTLQVKLPKEPVFLFVDSARLTQVLCNLLHNAAKYTPPGGRIEVTGSVKGNELVLDVHDTGQGIPHEMQERIFEMFAQIPRAHGTQEGLGIGLTLVKWIVELHEGQIEVFSDGPDQGSTFRLRLPLPAVKTESTTAPLAPSAAAVELPDNGAPRRRILVADDNRDAREMLSVMLRRLGNDVRTAGDGQEAVELARDWLPEVIFMDLGMPRLDGCGAAEQIRGDDGGEAVLLVAITGWDLEEDRRRTKAAGFDHHLVKPVELAALRRILDQAPAESHQRHNGHPVQPR
jgi:PAS domain S-box-containing protein